MARVKRTSKTSSTKKNTPTSKTKMLQDLDVVCVNTNTRFLVPHMGNELLFHQVERQSESYQKYKNRPETVVKMSECIVDSLITTAKSAGRECRFIVLTILDQQVRLSEMTKSQAIETVQKTFEVNLHEDLFPLKVDVPSYLKPYIINQEEPTPENEGTEFPVTPQPEDHGMIHSPIDISNQFVLPQANPAAFSKGNLQHTSNMSLAEAFGMPLALARTVPIVKDMEGMNFDDDIFEDLPVDDLFLDELAYLDNIPDAEPEFT